MERWNGRTALVTGASSGLGNAIARTLACNGVNVIGCARRSEKIEELATSIIGKTESKTCGTITAYKCDLTKEEDILRMFKDIETKFGHVDVLINNAGLGYADDLITGRTAKWKEMLDVNVMALSVCTRETLRLMKNNGIDDGHIINMNSTGGHSIVTSSPIAHYYCGTKHMVTALTKALNAELRQQRSKIRVTSLSPGVAESEFTDVRQAGVDPHNEESKSYVEQFHLYRDTIQPLSAQDVADAVIYILGLPAYVNIRELTIAPIDQAF